MLAHSLYVWISLLSDGVMNLTGLFKMFVEEGTGGRSLKSEHKQIGEGEGVLGYVHVRFFLKKCWDFENEVL